MVSIFKEKSTTAVIGVIFAGIALHAVFMFSPPVVAVSEDDGLLYYFLKPLAGIPPIFLSILYYGVILVQALRLNYLLNDIRMYQKPAFTAALSYIFLTALLPVWGNITAALIANSCIIWLLFRMVKLYNTPQPKSLVYNAGLVTGVTVLLYYPAFCIIPVIFFALGVTRPFRLNEWFVLLLGIITPAYFWCGYLFLTGQLEESVKGFTAIFQIHKVIEPNIKPVIIAFGTAGLVLITGILSWQANSNRILIQVRKIWGILFFMLLLFIPVAFVIKNAWPAALVLACLPAAAFMGNAFLYPKKIISALLFWLMVIVIVYTNWVALKN